MLAAVPWCGGYIVLIYGFLVIHSITQGQVTGATRWLADMFK